MLSELQEEAPPSFTYQARIIGKIVFELDRFVGSLIAKGLD
jgi:hypothetical protein